MNDKELDAAIAERFKVYEEEVRLPGEFQGRFIVFVRRKRMFRRIWTLGLICLTAAACVAVASVARPVVTNDNERTLLTAGAADTNEAPQVSYWVLLGYLRECISRCRSSRRKEDE